MIVADYSAGLPGAAALKRAGFAGAVRYVGQPGWTKNTNAAELADFDAHGLSMGFVFELSGGDWRGGYDAGVRNARAGRAHMDALGVQRDVPLYMAVDQDVVTEGEFAQAMSYLDGAASVVGKEWTGPYGEYEVCRRSWDRGYRWQWQCRAWSGTPIQHFGQRRLFQYFGSPYTEDGRNAVVGGIEVDTNEVNADNWGQHNGGDDVSFNEDIRQFQWNGQPLGENPDLPFTAGHALNNINNRTYTMEKAQARVEAKLDALAGTLSDDEANILAAIRSLPAPGEVDAEKLADSLAAPLAAAVAPMLEAGATPTQVETALRNVLRSGTEGVPQA